MSATLTELLAEPQPLRELREISRKASEVAGAMSVQNEVLRWAVENRDALRQPLIDSLIARLRKHVCSVTENGATP